MENCNWGKARNAQHCECNTRIQVSAIFPTKDSYKVCHLSSTGKDSTTAGKSLPLSSASLRSFRHHEAFPHQLPLLLRVFSHWANINTLFFQDPCYYSILEISGVTSVLGREGGYICPNLYHEVPCSQGVSSACPGPVAFGHSTVCSCALFNPDFPNANFLPVLNMAKQEKWSWDMRNTVTKHFFPSERNSALLGKSPRNTTYLTHNLCIHPLHTVTRPELFL